MSNHQQLVCIIRNAEGKATPVYGKAQGRGLTMGHFGDANFRHMVSNRRDPAFAAKNPGAPYHCALRDVQAEFELFDVQLRRIAPRAAAIRDQFKAGRIRPHELPKADKQYVKEISAALDRLFAAGQSDADSLFLYLETIKTMSKILEWGYIEPMGWDNAFPRLVLGTEFDTFRLITERTTGQLARVGGKTLAHSPRTNSERKELSFNLVPVDESAEVYDAEIRQYAEIRRNNPGPMTSWDPLRKRLTDASRAVRRRVAMIRAFGHKPVQIKGVLSPSAATGIPWLAANFNNATPATAYAELNKAIKAQFNNVNADPERVADSLAVSPQLMLRMTQDPYSDQISMKLAQMLMDGNPQINSIYQLRELEPNAAEKTALQAAGLSPAEAKRQSGGVETAANVPNKSAIIVYRKDAAYSELIVGYEQVTYNFAPVHDVRTSQVMESTGGFIAYEPMTLLIAHDTVA